MSTKSSYANRDGATILEKIFSPEEIRRFERMERVAKCMEITTDLKARHLYMQDEEIDDLVSELLALLIKEKIAAQMAHFYAIDEDSDKTHCEQVHAKKGFLARFRTFLNVRG